MEQRFTFQKTRRLGGRGVFKSIRDTSPRESRGPLTFWMTPNDRAYSRLGISIGKHVGIAARRNRIKRLLRESFRLMQSDLPRGYDVLIGVKPHEPLILAEYQRLLSSTLIRMHGKLQQKSRGTEQR